MVSFFSNQRFIKEIEFLEVEHDEEITDEYRILENENIILEYIT